MKTRISKIDPLYLYLGLIAFLLAIMVCHEIFTPKYDTSWNREMTHERDSIIKELKKEGIFYNIKN